MAERVSYQVWKQIIAELTTPAIPNVQSVKMRRQLGSAAGGTYPRIGVWMDRAQVNRASKVPGHSEYVAAYEIRVEGNDTADESDMLRQIDPILQEVVSRIIGMTGPMIVFEPWLAEEAYEQSPKDEKDIVTSLMTFHVQYTTLASAQDAPE